MDIFSAFIQGIIQGLTEFLPVSSSGHLAITQHIFGIQEENLFFSVMLHVGTLCAVIAVYFKLIVRLVKAFCSMIKDIFTGKFRWSQMSGDRNLVMMLIIGLIPLFLLFLPIPGTDMRLKDLADLFVKDGYLIIVSICLMVTSALLFFGAYKNRKTYITYKRAGKLHNGQAGRKRYNAADALFVGIVQCAAAVFPGISRSGSTLAAGEFGGINKQSAIDYSFVLGIPAILAAAVLETSEAFGSSASSITSIGYFPIIIGMVTSALVGFFAIKLFKWLLSTDRMYIFILYTAFLGIIMFVISIIELITQINIFTGAALNF